MKRSIAAFSLALAVAAAYAGDFNTFKIGGFTFSQTNTPTQAAIVEGPLNLDLHTCVAFGRYSQAYLEDVALTTNDFQFFDRSKSVGRLLEPKKNTQYARYVTLPEWGLSVPAANAHRTTIELSWQGFGLPNQAGPDFVVYEVHTWEGFGVAVRKAGSTEFTPYRYHFPLAYDKTHDVNAVPFDLSKFGLAEGDVIAAIRVRNLFSQGARVGADKVDDPSGEGWLVYPGEPRYKDAYVLRPKAGEQPFNLVNLDADIIYVAALHDIVPLKTATAAAASTPAAPAPTTVFDSKAAVPVSEKK